MIGYFQSWKYFHHARNEVLQSFAFPSYAEEDSLRLIDGIRKTVAHPEVVIVGVHVRLGDKISRNITADSYNQWSLSIKYYEKAIRVIQERRKYSKHPLAILFFTGGAVVSTKIEKDIHWTRNNLGVS